MNIYYWLLLPEPDKATQHDHMKARAGVKVECGDLLAAECTLPDGQIHGVSCRVADGGQEETIAHPNQAWSRTRSRSRRKSRLESSVSMIFVFFFLDS